MPFSGAHDASSMAAHDRARNLQILAMVSLVCGLISGCTGGQYTRPYSLAMSGYTHRGKQLIEQRHCGRCHTIPGIPGAHGVFGPPLSFMGRRSMIAGNFPNNSENLAHWVMSPKSMKPATAMPNLGLTPQESKDVAAYLESLH